MKSPADDIRRVQADDRVSANIRIPTFALPTAPKDGNALADWNELVSSLFEWLGMAGLGAQRFDPAATNKSVELTRVTGSRPTTALTLTSVSTSLLRFPQSAP